jgi:hypothetical protein
MRTTSFFLLTILCLALTASAQVIYNDGRIDGNDNAFFVTGPNLPSFLGTAQDISNGFVAANSGAGVPLGLAWGEWSVGTPTTSNWSIGTSAFGNDIASGGGGLAFFVETNPFGYGVWDVLVPIGVTGFVAGNTYWLTISNATDAANDGTQAWDIPNGGLGGPATCNFRQSGTNFGDCGLGGESFTIASCGCFCGVPGPDCGPTPEPSSILLFGSGILGIAGILRRKLNR